jgi:rhodanese-related sulfurtransferase
MPSHVTSTPPVPPSEAAKHFAHKLALETDCADVHETLKGGAPDFVLLDVRGRAAFARAHVPGATSLPHREITPERMMAWPHDTLFVVYCAGPHCNGADRAALKLSRLGRPVKVMLGGMTGWADEGFAFERSEQALEA